MAFGYLITRDTDDVERHMRDRWALPLWKRVVERVGERWTDTQSDSRTEVDSRLPTARSVFYFGHGSAHALGDPPLIDPVNVGLVEGMIVAIACHSAEDLGPTAITAGTQAYVGFLRKLPIVRAPVYDTLMIDSLVPLASGEASADEFTASFQAACGEVEEKYTSGTVRNANAHLIGSSAALMSERLRVLGDSTCRC